MPFSPNTQPNINNPNMMIGRNTMDPGQRGGQDFGGGNLGFSGFGIGGSNPPNFPPGLQGNFGGQADGRLSFPVAGGGQGFEDEGLGQGQGFGMFPNFSKNLSNLPSFE